MSRFRGQYSVLESKWGLNKDTSEVTGIRLLASDGQHYRPYMIELLRGDVSEKRMNYAHILDRVHDAHLAYQLFESYSDMFMQNIVELDPKDHPFIARMIREKELANKRYHPGSDWRYRYGMPPVIFSSSFMRYFRSSSWTAGIGWAILIIISITGVGYVL